MIPARQSTAFEIAVGPVLDAGGVAVTDCVVGDFKIKKTTGNFAALNGSATLTHVSAGVYDLVLTTSDTDTVGLGTVAIDDTVNACPLVYLQVIEEAVYDALYAASAAGYQVPIWSSASATVSLTNTTVATVTTTTTATTATNLTNLPTIPANWLTAAGTAADFTTEIQSGLATAAGVSAVEADTQDIQSRLPAALNANGNIKADVIDINGNDLTAGQLVTLVQNYADGALNASIVGNLVGNVTGDVTGKVLGGGAGTITGTGARVVDASGNAVAPASATTSISSAISALNNLSSAQAQTAAAAALTAYDPPTNAEMEARTVTSATYATAASIAALNNLSSAQVTAAVPTAAQTAAAVLTTAMTEAYRSAGATATLAQFVYEVIAHLGEFANAGTTKTLKKLDGSTTAKTFTYDSADTPTSITELS